jgi:hypothetical protein
MTSIPCSESSSEETYYDQNERDTYDNINTALKNATSPEEISVLNAQLDATRRFSGRWDWMASMQSTKLLYNRSIPRE